MKVGRFDGAAIDLETGEWIQRQQDHAAGIGRLELDSGGAGLPCDVEASAAP